jgi:hypothetical protein
MLQGVCPRGKAKPSTWGLLHSNLRKILFEVNKMAHQDLPQNIRFSDSERLL